MKRNSVIRTNELDSKEFFLRADKYFLSGLLLAILISILGNYIYLVLVLLIFYLFKREWGDRFLLSATILLREPRGQGQTDAQSCRYPWSAGALRNSVR